jgi:hypothetical protein
LAVLGTGQHVPSSVLRVFMCPLYTSEIEIHTQDVWNIRHKVRRWSHDQEKMSVNDGDWGDSTAESLHAQENENSTLQRQTLGSSVTETVIPGKLNMH